MNTQNGYNGSILSPLEKNILKLLQEDGRQSAEAVAKQLDVHPATVRRAIRRMGKEGMMRTVAVVDPKKIGLAVPVYFFLDVDVDKIKKVMEIMAGYPEVSSLVATSGRWDVIVAARFPSNDALFDFIKQKLARIPGLRDSETSVCFRHRKRDFTRIF